MAVETDQQNDSRAFRRGDAVTVRSLEEILATLDADAKLDGLPFMPEMVPCCGKTFRVFRRADKTCVEGVGMKSMRNTVFLDGLRCDGSAHEGCQRGCLFFWNEAWLKPAGGRQSAVGSRPVGPESPTPNLDSLASCPSPLAPPSHPSQLPTTKGDRFYCQSTELAGATTEFGSGKLRQLRHYLYDMWIGELGLRRFAYMVWLFLTNRFWRFLYGRSRYQLIGEQEKTVSEGLNLQPGELVEVKSPAEIRASLDAQGRNRGLSFEAEMAQHCGRRYRVAVPLRTIISEQSGKMLQLRNTVILEGLVCQGICANCPRANYFYWRESWLKRV
jgi:hypothetical protein